MYIIIIIPELTWHPLPNFQNGVFSSLPFLGKLVAGIVGGYLADLLLRRHLSIAAVRKTFQMAGQYVSIIIY